MTITAVQSYDDLVAFLDENKSQYTSDKPAQMVEIASYGPPLPGGLIVKWEKKVPFVQFLHFMINDVPAERIRELEAGIARLNHHLAAGGFGISHEYRRLYYRISIPVYPGQGLLVKEFRDISGGAVNEAIEFLNVFRDIVEGQPGEKAVEIQHAYTKARTAAILDAAAKKDAAAKAEADAKK